MRIVIVSILAAVVIGWILNIIKIIGLDFSAISGEHVVRIVGIFVAPIGGVAGYF